MNKIIIIISLLLNAVLIMSVLGPVPFFLYLSIIINVVLVIYSIRNVKKINDVENDFSEMLTLIENYTDHLDQVHSLEVFYGDETLQGLINHSRQLINDIIDVQEKHYDVTVDLETYDEQNENSQKESPEG